MVHIGEATSPRKRLRLHWADNLKSQLALYQWTPKRLHHELSLVGCDVTRQAVDYWLAGKTSPAPENQAAIAKVFRTAPHLLFPLDTAA